MWSWKVQDWGLKLGWRINFTLYPEILFQKRSVTTHVKFHRPLCVVLVIFFDWCFIKPFGWLHTFEFPTKIWRFTTFLSVILTVLFGILFPQSMCFAIFVLGFGMRMHLSAADGLVYFTHRMGTPTHNNTHHGAMSRNTAATPPSPGRFAVTASVEAGPVPEKAPGKQKAATQGIQEYIPKEDYIRSQATSTSEHSPIVFLHGVGCGFLSYLDFMRRLAALGESLPESLSHFWSIGEAIPSWWNVHSIHQHDY